MQEVRHLEEEAAQYKQWERSEEARALKCARVERTEDHRCVLTVEIASGSGDCPRVLRTMDVDMPLNGTRISVFLRADMERAPSEVSTVPAQPVIEDPAAIETQLEHSAAGEQAQSDQPADQPADTQPLPMSAVTTATSQEAQCNTVPGLLQLMDFDEYEVLFDRWTRGELNQREILLYYGADVLELMLAQEAVSTEDIRGHEDARQSREDDDEAHLGMRKNDDGDWVRIGYAQFEVTYGLWKEGALAEETICQRYGVAWLRLFRLWKAWGLQAIWHLLPRILDVLPDTAASRRGVDFHLLKPEPLPRDLRIPWFVVRDFHREWMAGTLTDTMVVARFGAVWLVWFRRLRDEGLERLKPELLDYVFWDEAEVRHARELAAIQETRALATMHMQTNGEGPAGEEGVAERAE